LEYFRDKTRRDEFYKFFKELSNMYEILSPDAFLRPYLESYMTLAVLYRSVLNNYDSSAIIGSELARKTDRARAEAHEEQRDTPRPWRSMR